MQSPSRNQSASNVLGTARANSEGPVSSSLLFTRSRTSLAHEISAGSTYSEASSSYNLVGNKSESGDSGSRSWGDRSSSDSAGGGRSNENDDSDSGLDGKLSTLTREQQIARKLASQARLIRSRYTHLLPGETRDRYDSKNAVVLNQRGGVGGAGGGGGDHRDLMNSSSSSSCVAHSTTIHYN